MIRKTLTEFVGADLTQNDTEASEEEEAEEVEIGNLQRKQHKEENIRKNPLTPCHFVTMLSLWSLSHCHQTGNISFIECIVPKLPFCNRMKYAKNVNQVISFECLNRTNNWRIKQTSIKLPFVLFFDLTCYLPSYIFLPPFNYTPDVREVGHRGGPQRVEQKGGHRATRLPQAPMPVGPLAANIGAWPPCSSQMSGRRKRS